MGKSASEHPTFLGWEHGLHPQLQGQAGVLQVDVASCKGGRHFAFIPWTANPTTARDTEILYASPSGKRGVMWEQHPCLQPAHAGLCGGDGS